MKINIFGSTGSIGIKTLNIISTYFPKIKINLLCANKNIKLFKKQIKLYKPKYIYLDNIDNYNSLKKTKLKKTKVLNFNELISYLKISSSDLTLFAISGIDALKYFESVIKNSKHIGLVNKECIVSAGHLLKKLNLNNKNLYPLDSEHFSINSILNNLNTSKLHSVKITASGGPFLSKKYFDLKNITFKEACNHPKWKMGYKNSIDSATMVNKCLEIVEAHYLFDIDYNNIEAVIHPESLVHSILKFDNYLYNMVYFSNDMFIPILNFLNIEHNKKFNDKINFNFNLQSLNFSKILKSEFPIYYLFRQIDLSKQINVIKFNLSNEFAVNLFKKQLISYVDIYKIISEFMSMDFKVNINSLDNIILSHKEINNELNKKFLNV